MSVFDSLRALWSNVGAPEASNLKKQQVALRRAWGLEEDDPVFADDSRELRVIAPESSSDITRLDHKIWQSKLFRIAEEGREHAATDPSEEILNLMNDRVSLGISDESAESTARSVLESAVRQVVADRHISLAELAWLHSLRNALGLTEVAAEEIVRHVVTEAETIFDTRIEGFNPVFGCDRQNAPALASD
jgi:hypothetical protein